MIILHVETYFKGSDYMEKYQHGLRFHSAVDVWKRERIWIRKKICGLRRVHFLFKLFRFLPYVNSRDKISARHEISPCNHPLNPRKISVISRTVIEILMTFCMISCIQIMVFAAFLIHLVEVCEITNSSYRQSSKNDTTDYSKPVFMSADR